MRFDLGAYALLDEELELEEDELELLPDAVVSFDFFIRCEFLNKN